MFDNIHEMYPEVNFWVLSSKDFDQEIVTTYDELIQRFGEARLNRIINNFDPFFIAYRKNG